MAISFVRESRRGRAFEILTFLSGTRREDDPKQGAVSLFALDVDATAVGFRGPAGNREAESKASGLSGARIVHAIEPLEDSRAMRGGNARSGVLHVDRRFPGCAGAHGDVDRPLAR